MRCFEGMRHKRLSDKQFQNPVFLKVNMLIELYKQLRLSIVTFDFKSRPIFWEGCPFYFNLTKICEEDTYLGIENASYFYLGTFVDTFNNTAGDIVNESPFTRQLKNSKRRLEINS